MHTTSSNTQTDYSALKQQFRESLSKKQHNKALGFIAKAIAIEPEDAELGLSKAFVYIEQGQLKKAVKAIQGTEEFLGDDVRLINYAAGLYSRCEQYLKSEAFYIRALKLKPSDSSLYYNLGTIQRFLGKLDAAADNFDQSFRLDSNAHEALCLSASVRKQTIDSNHIADINSYLQRKNLKIPVQVQLYYALAKEYEDLKEWDKSFEALRHGADIKRRNMRYDVVNDQNIMSAIANAYSNITIPTKSNNDSVAIFILGLPRTGSTLIESMLSSHNAIISGGELPDFSRQLDEILATVVPSNSTPQTITDRIMASASIDFELLGKNYLNAVANKINYTHYFTDKMPFNFLYCGLIMQALPNAKIIHTRRNPMDSCYAIYKTLFQHAYPYSYDLKELAQYYIAYFELMDHWHSVLPNQILNVDYEALVSDSEGQARTMIDFCGLDWDPDCMEFQSKQAITTASAAQVRSPVYLSSIEKWKNIEKQLEPLKEQFATANIACC